MIDSQNNRLFALEDDITKIRNALQPISIRALVKDLRNERSSLKTHKITTAEIIGTAEYHRLCPGILRRYENSY
jgi:hypothetical protein